jgi:hypothetical protein
MCEEDQPLATTISGKCFPLILVQPNWSRGLLFKEKGVTAIAGYSLLLLTLAEATTRSISPEEQNPANMYILPPYARARFS